MDTKYAHRICGKFNGNDNIFGTEESFSSVFMHFTSFEVCCQNIFKSQTFKITFLHCYSCLNYVLHKYLQTQNSVL